MCTILYMYLFHYHLDANCVGQLDFQFLSQDFQIQESGSQDFLIQNVSGSTVPCLLFWLAFLCFSALIANMVLLNRKRKVFKILTQLL